MSPRKFLAIGAFVLSFAASISTAQADPIDDLFDQGSAALREGNFQKAREYFAEVYQQRKTNDVAANLALAEMKLGMSAAAANHLAYAYAFAPVTSDPKARARIEALLGEVKPLVHELDVSAEEGATVIVDGQTIGLTPLGIPYYLEPGPHELVVEKGDRREKRPIDARAGASEKIEITLAVKPPPTERPVWPAALLGSVAAVGVGLGITGIVLSETGRADAEDRASDLPRGACNSDPTLCDTIQSDLDGAATWQAGGIVGFAVGGAALIGMIVYLVLPNDDATTNAVRIAPSVGVNNGLWIDFTF